MQFVTGSIYYPSSAVEATASLPPHPAERIIYSAESYSRIEDFESDKVYKAYIEQTKNDLIAIAEGMNLSDRVHDNISFFCNSLFDNKNFDFDLKKLVYTDLGQYLHGIRQLNKSCLSVDEATIRKFLDEVFDNLTIGIRNVLTNIIYASSAINSLTRKDISWHVKNRKFEVTEAVIIQHVECHHRYIDDVKKRQCIAAYKHHLAESKWSYSFLYKNKNVGKYIKSETEQYFPILLERLKQAVDIISIIKDIGNMMRRQIEGIINEPEHHEDIEGMRYLSERGHQAVMDFAQSSSPPMDLNTVLARNMANNCLFLLKDADAIYGSLAEALAVENNKEALSQIMSIIITDKISVKSFKDFFWVDYNGDFRGPLTLEVLRFIGVRGAVNAKLLRFAIINTPSESLRINYRSEWCKNIHSVFDNYLESNIFALYKLYFNQGMVNGSHTDKDGNTFLHAAAFHNDHEAYDYVSDKLDIIINCKNKFGVTALMQATIKGSTLMVLRLLECKELDISIAEKNGFTALGLAVKNQHEDIVTLLRSHAITINSRKRASEDSDNAIFDVNQTVSYCLSD